MKKEITCPSCHILFSYHSGAQELDPRYCPFCRQNLNLSHATTVVVDSHQKDLPTLTPEIPCHFSFLPEHIPSSEQILETIGSYQILESIGKGGMGEVFLAYDTTCGRRIALKKIRPDLTQHKQLHRRFLKEAHVTSQLAHPAIIPIYAIHSSTDLTYYTMPYIQGQTLKQILRTARQVEKCGQKVNHLMESIPALMRIFLSICQAIAYAHSKQILHRDLKPENVIIGQYGQVVILDWGLAKIIHPEVAEEEDADEEIELNEKPLHNLTYVGKIVGTVLYMAPEQVLGKPASFQTDVYSLGVVLYQLLTLKIPFYRESVKAFRRVLHQETILDPSEAAPYRDVPHSLSRVVMKCLAPTPEQRYKTVDELIHDIENYIEGRSEWFQITELDIKNKNDWEFQENVLIAEHVALSHQTAVSDWVSLMISKTSFRDNIKLEAQVKIGDRGHGVGFLLCIPEKAEREHLNDGYCLWLGVKGSKSTKLLRSTVEVIHSPEIFLERHEWYHVRIEKIDQNIYFYLNNILQFSYISYLPLTGTHIGLISRDDDFALKNLMVYIGSQNVTVNCLAVPDAFLAHKNYATALTEYRRIGYSFPGRAEGREAMFRAGVTLLEQANSSGDKEKKAMYYDLALEEFNKLHHTPGAPLEYLGKALVYQALGDHEEEAKCFELAYRRYPRHPLLPVLQEKIIHRMHDISRYDRKATFNFIFLALRYIPNAIFVGNTNKLLVSLEKHWESLPFIEHDPLEATLPELSHTIFGIKLAFWLGRSYIIEEIINELLANTILPAITIGNALFCLIELGSWELAQKALEQVIQQYAKRKIPDFDQIKKAMDIILLSHVSSLEVAVNAYINTAENSARTMIYLMEAAIEQDKTSLVHQLYRYSQTQHFPQESELQITAKEIWALLLENQVQSAGNLLHTYPLELLSQETTILHFLYGCWLYVTEGKDIGLIHFSGVLEVPYPRTWAVFSYYVRGKFIDNGEWKSQSFLWERRQLYRQIALFYHCIEENEKAQIYKQRALAAVV